MLSCHPPFRFSLILHIILPLLRILLCHPPTWGPDIIHPRFCYSFQYLHILQLFFSVFCRSVAESLHPPFQSFTVLLSIIFPSSFPVISSSFPVLFRPPFQDYAILFSILPSSFSVFCYPPFQYSVPSLPILPSSFPVFYRPPF